MEPVTQKDIDAIEAEIDALVKKDNPGTLVERQGEPLPVKDDDVEKD